MMVINILGVLLIALIVWWFWLYREPAAAMEAGEVTIEVKDGIYSPAHIRLKAGQSLSLKFIRRDPSPCASVVVFEDFDVSEELPLNKARKVELPPMQPGRYPFTCQMQMYKGELIVEKAADAHG
ncbi:cupredoxin domain-containing protein [Marinobacterium sediminicola]|uniref:Cupredoxin-like domain-containing protein n=1 Tax=Marinobacterium sediminicola TaxID=518898 RepID=A0ABY1S2C4_9GAMM|nr:cupredoxin domain-containing protein [Marinobacterium sediminicola]ULG68478.1 cupredoxin domain-containing protein [Marinobacterium sediminicola]SMR76750.1 Cupredoxin-like domain-containing protein [Marinobacterium sediminicola]